MISFKDFRKLDEARKGNPYNYEKDSGAKGLAHKVGDSVWAKHPTEKSKTIAGKVTKIGRTLTTLQHKDGTEATYPHADVSVDFSKLNPNPYRKNESEELDEAASTDNLPISNVHKHIQRFMGMGTSLNLAKHMKTGTATHTSWEKVNSGLKAIGVKPQHISTLAVKIRPAQYDEQEELDEGAPIVVPFAHTLKQAADQRKQSAADKEKLRASIVTPYQLGKKHKAEGKPNSNPHKFVKAAGAAGNYDHNSYNAGFNESVELDEADAKVDHTLGHKIAKNLGTKLKTFAHGRYVRDNSVIPGNIEYTFHDNKVTHKDVHAALVKSGFKAPRHNDIMHDHESMKSWTNSAVSPTHTAHTTQEHGGPLKLHIQARNVAESEELDEATFVSDSPATYGSRGTKFDVKKNKEKSTGEHANGQPVEHHDVYHEGKHVGHVASYSGYKDKKPAGSRIVTSRKNVRLWQATVHGGEHNRHGSVFNTTPAGSQYTGTGFASKKDALQHFADAHNSNKSR